MLEINEATSNASMGLRPLRRRRDVIAGDWSAPIAGFNGAPSSQTEKGYSGLLPFTHGKGASMGLRPLRRRRVVEVFD